MRIVCVGGGPAGLYFALLKKILSPDDEILVVERSGEERPTVSGWSSGAGF